MSSLLDSNVKANLTPLSEARDALHNLWHDPDHLGKQRACLFNLVVFTNEEKDQEETLKMIKSSLQKFPQRLFFISYKKNLETLSLKIAVESANSNGEPVSSDILFFETGQESLKNVPFALLPHLIPDLPIYFYWPSPLFKHANLMQDLAPFTTKIILDSQYTPNISSFKEIIFSLMKHQTVEIADLNWVRSEGWRDILFHFFQTEEKQDLLKNIISLDIEYNHKESDSIHKDSIQAFYLQQWLSTQVGWTHILEENELLQKKTVVSCNKKNFTITINPSFYSHFSSGTLTKISFHFENQKKCY